MLASLIFYSILATPVGVIGQSPDPVPAPRVEALGYGAVVDQLRLVDAEANRDPVGSIDALTQAISALEGFAPQLSRDPEALELRGFARLNLARAHLMAGQPELADQVMDVALRAAMGANLEVESFGPALLALYEQRLAALQLQGYAGLEISCDQPCRIFVEQKERDHVRPLLLGSYAVWVEDVAGQHAPMRELIELREAGEVYTLRYGAAELVALEAPDRAPLGNDWHGQVDEIDRIMPPWVSVTLLLAGAAAAAAGGAMTGIGDHNGDNGLLLGGATLLGAGAAGLTVGLVVLTVDENRTNRASRQATLSWSIRF